MNIDVITLFPEYFDWFLSQHQVKNLQDRGHKINIINLRDYSQLSGHQVDDKPYGGGAGMLLRVDVMAECLESVYSIKADKVKDSRQVIALTPTGRTLNESVVMELSQEENITLLCGRYEGFDNRIITEFCSDTISIGNYVLNGGEIAAFAVMDSVLRKLPGALQKEESHLEDSFSDALDGGLEYPQYTRPAEWRGVEVPEELLSGNHKVIKNWRKHQSKELTLKAEDRH